MTIAFTFTRHKILDIVKLLVNETENSQTNNCKLQFCVEINSRRKLKSDKQLDIKYKQGAVFERGIKETCVNDT